MQIKCIKLVQIAPFSMTALDRVIKNNGFGAKRDKQKQLLVPGAITSKQLGCQRVQKAYSAS